MRILLDLDCVLADFVDGCCREWGLLTQEVYSNWRTGEYPMNNALAKTLGWEEMSDAQFWQKLNGKARFWAELPRTPWMVDLLELCYHAASPEETFIVTSPSHCPTSYYGKAQWLKEHFGSTFSRFDITPHKERFGRIPGTILIDDHEGNCEKFRKAGGRAILFPAHHNSLHHLKHDPLSFVREALKGASDASQIP